MSSPMTLTTERDLAQVIDQVARTGEVVELQRPGGRVRISRTVEGSRLARLRPHPGTIEGDLDDLAKLSWADHWRPLL